MENWRIKEEKRMNGNEYVLIFKELTSIKLHYLCFTYKARTKNKIRGRSG
jgi:hypothetical protein